MIIIKTDAQIETMRKAGSVVAETLRLVKNHIRPGITTAEIDRLAEDFILSRGAKPAFKGYHGFPASTCISIDDEVVHGIPGARVLMDGQIVSVDLGAIVGGYYGDSAATFPVGEISEEKRKLLEVTQRSLEAGIARVKAGNRLGEVSAAVQETAEAAGFSVVRELVGHGIGKAMHEDPQVPNFGSVNTKVDGWTVVTADGSPSAHFEHTVAVTDDGCDILTL
ncbi:MAG: type I methionyl aminopeptidase [candidate division Zixibacteria bacterium]|nr:type I methionyl aminopeptidase [candidate division Zixibacteria bacterium]